MPTYPHMCRDGHQEIGHRDQKDDELCPLCRARNEIIWLRSSLVSLYTLAESDSAKFTNANVAEVCRRALEKYPVAHA